MTTKTSLFAGASIAVCAALFLCTTLPAHAATVRSGEVYELSADTQVAGDLYLLAEQVLLHGTTSADVYAGGAYVQLSGQVGEDLSVAGGSVVLGGAVAGDVRVVAGKVIVRGVVEEDLVILAGTVLFEDGARIGGDLLVYAEDIRYQGVTVGAAELRGRAVTLNGSFSENVQVYVSESLGLLDNAELQGTLSYAAPREAFFADGATTHGEILAEIESRPVPSSAAPVVGFAFEALMYALSALLIVWLAPRYVRRFSDRAIGRESGMLALKGFALLFAVPVFATVLFVTVFGALLGGVVLMGYLATLVLAFVCAPVLVGTILAEWLRKREERLRYGWVMLGAVVFALFSVVPVIGFIVRILIISLAFGTLLSLLFERYWPGRKVGEPHAQPSLFDVSTETRDETATSTTEQNTTDAPSNERT